jgi:hypothetical protein
MLRKLLFHACPHQDELRCLLLWLKSPRSLQESWRHKETPNHWLHSWPKSHNASLNIPAAAGLGRSVLSLLYRFCRFWMLGSSSHFPHVQQQGSHLHRPDVKTKTVCQSMSAKFRTMQWRNNVMVSVTLRKLTDGYLVHSVFTNGENLQHCWFKGVMKWTTETPANLKPTSKTPQPRSAK